MITAPIAFGAGTVAGLAIAALVWLAVRRKKPVAAAAPSPTALPKPLPTGRLRPNVALEREVAAVWLQFLRREVAETVGAINSRTAVVRALLNDLSTPPGAPAPHETLEKIATELERLTATTDSLHAQVSSTAPRRALPSVAGRRPHTAVPGVVLLVESDDTTREVLGQLFQRLGHRVLPARDGIEALTLLEQESVDCVVSETRASRLSGPGLHSQVEERMPQLARRFVFIAGDTQLEDVRAFLDRCDCHVIPKPFDVNRLVEAVSEVLDVAVRERAEAHQEV